MAGNYVDGSAPGSSTKKLFPGARRRLDFDEDAEDLSSLNDRATTSRMMNNGHQPGEVEATEI